MAPFFYVWTFWLNFMHCNILQWDETLLVCGRGLNNHLVANHLLDFEQLLGVLLKVSFDSVDVLIIINTF